jgi:hypothetical protein
MTMYDEVLAIAGVLEASGRHALASEANDPNAAARDSPPPTLSLPLSPSLRLSLPLPRRAPTLADARPVPHRTSTASIVRTWSSSAVSALHVPERDRRRGTIATPSCALTPLS